MEKVHPPAEPFVPETLADLEVLSAEECAAVREVVHRLREHWVQRHPALPFYTLGAASYMDAAEDKAGYYRKARQYNPVLRESLEWLYARVAGVLSQRLGAEVTYRESAALPGFHIFLGHPGFTQAMASVHRDLQYRLLDWAPEEEPDFTLPLSFTLAMTLPAHGGGMHLWDVFHEEIDSLPQPQVTQLIRSRPMHFHAYTPGKVLLASGHRVHRIAHREPMRPGDERLTLQGHGVRCRGVWHLYW